MKNKLVLVIRHQNVGDNGYPDYRTVYDLYDLDGHFVFNATDLDEINDCLKETPPAVIVGFIYSEGGDINIEKAQFDYPVVSESTLVLKLTADGDLDSAYLETRLDDNDVLTTMKNDGIGVNFVKEEYSNDVWA